MERGIQYLIIAVYLLFSISISSSESQTIPGIGGIAEASKVAIEENIAYVADKNFGLTSIDITALDNPKIIGSGDFSFVGKHITLFESFAIVMGSRTFVDASGRSKILDGIYLFNKTDPSALKLIGKLEFDYGNGDILGHVAVLQDKKVAYVPAGGNGVHVLDLSNPLQPEVITTIDTPGWARDVAISGNYLYVADGSQGLRVLDITNPLSPRLLDSQNLTKGNLLLNSNLFSVALEGNLIYAVGGGTLSVIDITSKTNPSLLGSFHLGHPHFYSQVKSNGQYVYVSGGVGGLVVFNVSNPAEPSLINSLPPVNVYGAQTLGVDFEGSKMIISQGVGGLSTLDLRSPSQPVLLKSITQSFEGRRIVQGNGFIALIDTLPNADGSSVKFIDVSKNPHQIIGEFRSYTASISDIAIVGNYILAASGPAGVAVIDVSSLQSPRVVTTYDTAGWAWGISVLGNYAYIADGIEGLRILDITNPASPKPLDTSDPTKGVLKITGGNSRGITVVGDLAYVASSSLFAIVNVSDKRNPSALASRFFGSPTYISKIVVKDSYAYISGGVGGLIIMDVSNPRSLTQVTTISPRGSVTGATTTSVALNLPNIYISNLAGGVSSYDISTIANPKFRETFFSTSSAYDLMLVGDTLYSASDPLGLEIVKISNSASASDTTKPSITITTPANRSVVSGNISVEAAASDNAGVAGVQFKVDNTNEGAEDRVTPYNTILDTTKFTNGLHNLSAIARDSAGNINQYSINILINNSLISSSIADINQDRIVNLFDLVLVARDYGKTSGFDPRVNLKSDDSIIDLNDLTELVKYWGATY